MVFMLIAGFLLVFGWLSLSFQRLQKRYSVFTDGMTSKTLDAVLNKVIREGDSSQRVIEKLMARCDTIEKNERLHIQKIGLLRFNPFKDTGGDQSFIMTLMDDHNTGVVITALYARSGTRWYAKRVVNGVGVEHELSEEEKKAIKVAKTTS